MTSDSSRHRLGILAVTALSLFGALFARLWILQVVEGEALETQARQASTREVITPAPRGRILDRNGVVLVDNRPSVVLGIDRQEFEDLDDDEQKKLLKDLSSALNDQREDGDEVTPAFIRRRLNNDRYSPYRPIPVAEDLSIEDEIYFEEQAHRFPTVSVERTTVRTYPYGSLAAHVLGYVGPLSDTQWNGTDDRPGFKDENLKGKPYVRSDEIGKSGVEASYEPYLRGTPGRRVYEVDRNDQVVREITAERVDPKPGDDLYLAIDAKVQYKAEEALQARLVAAQTDFYTADSGGLVVLDPTNGQVRAMASYPTYNPADLVDGISDAEWAFLNGKTLDDDGKPVLDEDGDEVTVAAPLLNRASAGAYPPASTFKLATAYAALKLGLITPTAPIQDPGYYRLCDGDGPGCLKTNAGSKSHGTVALAKSLTVSSDVYYYMIGEDAWAVRDELGDDALQRHMRELGYGSRTGLDLPGESPGNVPDPASLLKVAEALYERNPGNYEDLEDARNRGRWVGGNSADLAIGQKIDATPLQTANAYAALANGGTLWTPTLLDRLTAAHRPEKVTKAFEKKAIRTIDWGDGEAALLQGFVGVVNSGVPGERGTAYSTFQGFPLDRFPLAGKTGTAQTGVDEFDNEKPDNSLFVGYGTSPGSPWLASAMLEHAGSGSAAAAPAVRLVLEPIADGSIENFVIPKDGTIDAERVAEETSDISTAGTD